MGSLRFVTVRRSRWPPPPTVVQREVGYKRVFFGFSSIFFYRMIVWTQNCFFSCRATYGRHFEYPCYGGLTHEKFFLGIWKKVFSSFLLFFHPYQSSLRDQYFGFRSSKNQFFLRLMQYLAFYWPDDKTFYIKVTPWPCTKSETCIIWGCKVLRASGRTWNESFSVKNILSWLNRPLKW